MSGIKRTAADKWFSDYVRLRDHWTCQRCGRRFRQEELQGLDCAHGFGRGSNMTRFEPDNALAMCYGCHSHMDANPEEKREMFIKKIGEERYQELRVLSAIPFKGVKKEQKAISALFRQKYRDLAKNEVPRLTG